MKLFKGCIPEKNVNVSKFGVGAILACMFMFNSLNAAEYSGLLHSPFIQKVKCELKCTSNGAGGSDCVFVPAGCNNKSDLKLPNSRLDSVTNPKLSNPKLVNPKRNLLPGDHFQPKKIK
ncbi:hypothetical protein OO007_07135 [Cocleimonas sp. KMM 6892]|uniref:hypothetical protein n=1 Tax=unclassified Cocleimonas TaxID=2639732 RepID=UPI002DB58E9B|nr:MULTISPECIES: hypothetical protein [unclassified Cocleimonas]MEB8431996.1 hypothetical protein [Cocleimonas sp. KMM 6892]MEC4714918.1 hypothetical protein [Cocleimonas sp. KMM 6895]MEC4744268.1 hypothetical protein [Cocleimonas sp. KMM 6896]